MRTSKSILEKCAKGRCNITYNCVKFVFTNKFLSLSSSLLFIRHLKIQNKKLFQNGQVKRNDLVSVANILTFVCVINKICKRSSHRHIFVVCHSSYWLLFAVLAWILDMKGYGNDKQHCMWCLPFWLGHFLAFYFDRIS